MNPVEDKHLYSAFIMNGSTLTAVEYDWYLKAIYDTEKYGEGDDLVTYMSMRDNGRETRQQYLESLQDERQQRLKHEQDRIAKLRVKFFANRTKVDHKRQ